MNDLHSFFLMGGYAAYVWPSYAVFLLVLLADMLAPRRRRRRVLRELHARLVRQANRKPRPLRDQADDLTHSESR